MNSKNNDESEKRERFHTCTDNSVEEMEKFFDNKEKEIEGKGSDMSQKLDTNTNDKILTQNKNKKVGPRVKTSEKLVTRKKIKNRTKEYGFVSRVRPKATADIKSPPSKTKRIERLITEEESMENENVDEDEDINEVFEKEINDNNNDNDVEEITSNKSCIDCNQMYNDEKSNKEAKTKCRICKSNEHGCLKKTLYERSKGDTWLCADCVELTNMIEKVHPNLFSNLRKTLLKKGIVTGGQAACGVKPCENGSPTLKIN